MSESEARLTRESRLRLTGGRFDAPGFPLDGLAELAQYETLVVDVAKAIWLSDHQDRKRVPKGFASAIGLRLFGVRDGSSIPVLGRPVDGSGELDIDPPSVVDQAQDLIDEAFLSIVERNQLPAAFPSRAQDALVRLGKSLRAGEAIEIGAVRDYGTVARYSQAVRTRFLRDNQRVPFSREGVVVGRITALDTDKLVLTITDMSGALIGARFSDEALTEDLLEVFNRRDHAPFVRIECTQRIDGDGHVQAVDDISALEVFLPSHPGPTASRLVELLRLDEGWLDGEGLRPDLLALEFARDLVEACGELGLPDPSIYPRPDGGLQVQWIDESDVWTAELGPDGIFEVDTLDVVADRSLSASVSNPSAAAEFFAARHRARQR